jgi:hypothetical protein
MNERQDGILCARGNGLCVASRRAKFPEKIITPCNVNLEQWLTSRVPRRVSWKGRRKVETLQPGRRGLCVAGRLTVSLSQSGLLRLRVKAENMMLKLILIRSPSLAFASTECCR